MRKPPDKRTVRVLPALDAEDRMRRAFEEARAPRLAEINDAFAFAATGSPEDDKADEVRAYLTVVVKNIESYGSRVRVANPETGQVAELGWLELCGRTIRELGLSPQLSRLLYEYVASLLPADDDRYRDELASAAGMERAKSLMPEKIELFKKKGIVASFVAKLFVDSKALVSDAAEERADGYLASAVDTARKLEESPYLTVRDRKFLETCRRNYDADLAGLVERQRTTVLESIRQRGKDSPVVERALRRLMKGVFAARAVQDMDDWLSGARTEFTPRRYVYARLDDFRAELKRRMAGFERQELEDPIGAAKSGARRTRELVDRFNREVGSAGVRIDLPAEGDVNLFQALRAGASDLGRQEVVKGFDRFLSSEDLLDTYVRYEVARFKKDEPSLRQRINSDLVIWDEVYRSAPLTRDQASELEGLRADLVAYLREAGLTVPEEVVRREWVFPFAAGVFSLLSTEGQFQHFLKWVDRVRAIHDKPTEHTEPMRLSDLEELERTHTGITALPQGKALADEWTPKLGDATVVEEYGIPVRPSGGGGRPGAESGGGGRSFRSRLWPWNWFRKNR